MEAESYRDMSEEFRYRDLVTGKKGINVLNKNKLSDMEMDQIFNDWCYE